MDERDSCPFCALVKRCMRGEIQQGHYRVLHVSLVKLGYKDGQQSPESFENYAHMPFKFCPVCGKEVIF